MQLSILSDEKYSPFSRNQYFSLQEKYFKISLSPAKRGREKIHFITYNSQFSAYPANICVQ